ncbi:hypothetical protein REPUB_Repub13aG0277700 [Reevesia pubescens]
MALSLVTSGLNAVGSIVSMTFVDRYGRRRMMIISMIGIIACLVVLSIVFSETASHSPKIDQFESTHYVTNATCLSFASAANPASWNCMSCLKAECVFSRSMLGIDHRSKEFMSWTTSYLVPEWLPKKIRISGSDSPGIVHHFLLPGMGTVPWIMNSEIYPLRYRGISGGMAAVSNWISNLIVSETFLTLTKALGSAGTFLLFVGFCVIGLICIYWFVPETKGLQFEETGFKPKLFRRKSKGETLGLPRR